MGVGDVVVSLGVSGFEGVYFGGLGIGDRSS